MKFRIWISLFLFGTFVQANIPQSERQALIDIYHSYKNPPDFVFNGWLDEEGQLRPPGTEGEWNGVGLDEEGTHVLELSLSYFDATALPDSISNLSELASFYLDGRGMEVSFPASLGDIETLKFVHLGSCLGTGFPQFLFNLTDLQQLGFYGNVNLKVPVDLNSLDHLTFLSISSCGLSEFDWSIIDQLPQLTILDLSHNQIDEEAFSIGAHLQGLSYLVLSGNKIHGPLFEDWSKARQLEYLSFENNQLEGPIPAGIGDALQLFWLSLADNNLQGEVPEEIGNLSRLRNLNLSRNQLTGDLRWIQHLTSLSNVDLELNGFSGDLHWLQDLCSLERLELGFNSLSGTALSTLGVLSKLAIIRISGNQLSDGFPSDTDSFSELVSMDLSDNEFSGDVPEFLCEREELQNISLSYNHFTSFPPCLLDNPRIYEIMIGHNDLGEDFCTQVEDREYVPIRDNYYIQNDKILPCYRKELSVLPWLPEEQAMWNSQVFGFNPDWDFDSISYIGSSLDYIDSAYPRGPSSIGSDLYKRVDFNNFKPLFDEAPFPHGMAAFFFSQGYDSVVQSKIAYKYDNLQGDYSKTFAIDENQFSQDVLLPHFSASFPGALAISFPLAPDTFEVDIQLFGSQGLVDETTTQVSGFHPTAAMVEDLFPSVNLPEHYMIRIAQPDGYEMAALGYQFIPGKGISISKGLPVGFHRDSLVLPFVPQSKGWESTLSFSNPGNETALLDVQATDLDGNGIKRWLNIPARSVQSIKASELFPGLGDFSLFADTSEEGTFCTVHLFSVDQSKSALAQENAISFDSESSLLHLGVFYPDENLNLVVLAPLETEPTTFTIEWSLQARDYYYGQRDFFGTRIPISDGTVPHVYPLDKLMKESVPRELWEKAKETGCSLSIRSEEGVKLAACLYDQGVSLLQAEPYDFVDLALERVEWRIQDESVSEVLLTLSNFGSLPSKENAKLYLNNWSYSFSKTVFIPSIAPGETIQILVETEFTPGTQLSTNFYEANYGRHDLHKTFNLDEQVFIFEDSQITQNEDDGLDADYVGILFGDQPYLDIHYSSTDPGQNRENFVLERWDVELQGSYSDPNAKLDQEWVPCPDKLVKNEESNTLRIQNLDANRVYRMRAFMDPQGDSSARDITLLLQKSTYPEQAYTNQQTGKSESNGYDQVVSPFYPKHLAESFYPRPENFSIALSMALDLDQLRNMTLDLPEGVFSKFEIINRTPRHATMKIEGQGTTRTIIQSLSVSGFYDVQMHDFAVLGRLPDGTGVEEVSGVGNGSIESYPYDEGFGIQLKETQRFDLRNLDIRYLGIGIDCNDNLGTETEMAQGLIQDVSIAYGYQGMSVRNQEGLYVLGDGNHIYHMSTQGVLINNQSQYCFFDGLKLEGCRHRGFNVEHASDIAIQNCKIFDSGLTGIHLNGGLDTILVQGNEIHGVDRDVANAFGDGDLELNGGIYAYRPLYEGIKAVQGFAGTSRHILILDNQIQDVGDGIALEQANLEGVLVDGNTVSARRRGCRLEFGFVNTMTGEGSVSFSASLSQVYVTQNNSFELENDPGTILNDLYYLFFPCPECETCGLETLGSYGQDLYRNLAFFPFPFNYYSSNDCEGDCTLECRQWIDNSQFMNEGNVYLPLSIENSFLHEHSNALSIDLAPATEISDLKQSVLDTLFP